MKSFKHQPVEVREPKSVIAKVRNYVVAYAQRCRHSYLSLLCL